MIVILRGADFSANNIGTIDVPFDPQPETIEILSRVTKYDIDSEQAKILDQFIYSLKDSGIWPKLKYLALPIMADTLPECFINVIDGVSYGPTSQEIYQKQANGYRVDPSATLSTSTNNDAHKFGLNTLITADDFALGVYDASGNLGNQAVMGSNTHEYLAVSYALTRLGLPNAGYKINADQNHINAKGLRSVAVSVANSKAILNYCGLPDQGSEADGLTLASWANSSANLFKSICFNGYALGSFGTGSAHSGVVPLMYGSTFLTANELSLMSEYADGLIGHLSV